MFGKKSKKVVEVPLSQLYPIHPVPRRQVPRDHISKLANSIRRDGYDIKFPITATRLPNGDLIVTGGHHRLAAMKLLLEETIPTQVTNYSEANQVSLTWLLGIAVITGMYDNGYFEEFYGSLNEKQQQRVDYLLRGWRRENGY